MGNTRDQTWIYHKTEGSKIVFMDEAKEWFDKGWVDTPAKFGKKQEVKKPEPVEQVAEKIEEQANPESIDDASDLSDYLNEEYDLKTNFRYGLKKLKEILKRKLDDNSIKDN